MGEYTFTEMSRVKNRQKCAFWLTVEHWICTGVANVMSRLKGWLDCQLMQLWSQRMWLCNHGWLSRAAVWHAQEAHSVIQAETITAAGNVDKHAAVGGRGGLDKERSEPYTHVCALSNIHRDKAGCQHAVISWHFTRNSSKTLSSGSWKQFRWNNNSCNVKTSWTQQNKPLLQ